MSELELRIAGVVGDSIVDGPGLRLTVFTQGCPHRCEGCHNPETHDFAGGSVADIDAILAMLDRSPITRGLTLSGGEPFSQAAALLPLVRAVRARGKDVFAYSGYRYEELVALASADSAVAELLDLCDYLVDGRFVLAERDLTLVFRGSRNQRVIDLNGTRAAGEVVLADY